jgi:dehydrogenase/reductase SDR family protein 12
MKAIDLIDAALDFTLVGYSKIGFLIRERSWEPREPARLDGRVVVVTGATSGIGLASAEGFARLGASVLMVGRERKRTERACAQVAERSGSEDVAIELCDLSNLAEVRALAERIGARTQQLDVLVNNAGVLSAQRRLSAEGIELTFATNVLGPFLLTGLLSPILARGAPGRVINVSSGGMYTQRLEVKDLQMAGREFDGALAYARTKRAEVVLSELWAQRLRGRGVVVCAMHPGWVDTPGLASSLPGFHRLMRPLLRTPQQGADTILWLAGAPEALEESGAFWHDRRVRPAHRLPWTVERAAEREQLWRECERLCTPAGDRAGRNGVVRR